MRAKRSYGEGEMVSYHREYERCEAEARRQARLRARRFALDRGWIEDSWLRGQGAEGLDEE
jgi:hypothetical protein